MRTTHLLCSVLTVAGLSSAAEPARPRFARKPSATRANGKVRIEFAVDRETDVAVFIENGGGKVVRHLVAGVLGQKPPSPLRPGLAQSIEWDGKADYGKPAGVGPFKARVALGMNVRYDKTLVYDPCALQGVTGLATGPDGTLYVLTKAGGSVWAGDIILAFNRDGSYQRMVSPFGTDLKMDQVKDLGAFELNGRPTPIVYSHRLGLAPGLNSRTNGIRKLSMAVTPDGKTLLRPSGGNSTWAVGIGGEAVWGNPDGPPLLKATFPPSKDGGFRGQFGRPFLAVSSDGKWAYVSGFKSSKYENAIDNPAVFRVPLPARTPATPFLGDPLKKGKDRGLLGGPPRGLAADGKGNLFVADQANDRVVVVAEADGKYVGEFGVQKPDCVGVDPASGAVYVTSQASRAGAELIKYGAWKDAKELARLPLRLDGNGSYDMAVDTSAKPPLVWIGTDAGALLRVEDLGNKFEGRHIKGTGPDGGRDGNSGAMLDVSVDRLRKEVYARFSNRHERWYRYSESDDKTAVVTIPDASAGGIGCQLRAAPDGNLYGQWYPCSLRKYTRDGGRVNWKDPMPAPAELLASDNRIAMKPHDSFVPVSESGLCHTLGVRWSDGHLFVFQPIRLGGRPPKALHEYLPTGKRLTQDPIIWEISDVVIGPYFDPIGNIYVADFMKPKGWHYPPELDKALPAKDGRLPEGIPQYEAAHMYGSILKFSPKGGLVDLPDKGLVGHPRSYEGEPKLDPSLKTMELEYFYAGFWNPVKVTGAEWVHPGVSHIGIHAGDDSCTCESITIDVDEFGRVWFPDINLFQVRVIDTNGNALTRFGGYGNAESMGPESPVVDPETGKVRPRRADDPRDLVSPFAEPEIAFAWPVGVAATDKYVYTGDSINRRMLRLKQTYAAEETVDIR